MMDKISKYFYCWLLLLALTPVIIYAQELPGRPHPPVLVNDFAGLLSPEEVQALENKLVAFNDSTSTQIAIVSVNDLMGYDVADYAQRLAQEWGIGQKELDNGMLILVKPKTPFSQGQVTIQQGYGLEGRIPDLTCAQIIDHELIPAFRQEDYYGGLDQATDVLMALASEEYSADEYGRQHNEGTGSVLPFIIFIIVIVIIMFMRGSGGRNQKHISDRGLPLWILLSMMSSGRASHSGSWGSFSGGGRSSGGFGSGGGFGGFGGGSFGGGGASGSW